jgi:hypothetical protein
MAIRVSAAARAKVSIRAEAEIARYQHDHYLWHKYIHNVELDPVQLLKCLEMDRHSQTIDVSCRRTGKTAVKEMYNLKELATNPHWECGIFAPRLQQSQTNMMYQTDAIRRSQVLRAYVAHKSGREQLSDLNYQLVNGSSAQAYGIMSQVDGDGLVIGDLEEIDDMPLDRLQSRVLPMLGSARRLGVSREISFKPQIRVTGVFKGADVLQSMIDGGGYHMLQTVNVHLGIEIGILNEAFVLEMRNQLPDGEYIRQFLCRNVSSQNHIWEKYIRLAMMTGLKARLEIVEPMPGARYKKRGVVGFGYDHSGHGESATASESALVVAELLGNFVVILFVKTWPAGTDDKVIARDLIGFWEYFRPNYAMGDAYGVGMLTDLNDKLFQRGLTEIDRQTIGYGESTATTWRDWAFAPIRFDGMVKHSMASQLRAAFHNEQMALPYFDDGGAIAGAQAAANVKWEGRGESSDPNVRDWIKLVRQLNNIKAEASKAAYPSYRMANPKLGDDLFDAACAAVWALITRGENDVPTTIQSRTQTREQLLGRGTPALGRAVDKEPA